MYAMWGGFNAEFTCAAMTPAEVYSITFERFEELSKECGDLVWWMRNLLIGQMFSFERKYVIFQTHDAATRYEQFCKARPEIVNQIPNKYIAQYLNITPETLSRIRSRRNS